MMVFFLVFLYLVLYLFLCWKNFRWGVGILILLLPAYLIRFNVWKLPTTLLEVTFGALFFIWFVKYAREDWRNIKNYIVKNKGIFVFLTLFLIGSVVGIFVSDMWWASLGQWRAYFLEPILLFFVLLGRVVVIPPTKYGGIRDLKKEDLIWFLILSTISISLLAVVQKVTGQFYAPSLWDDQLFGRATSFFTTPNAVGLYLAPIILLSLSIVIPTRFAGAIARRAELSEWRNPLKLKGIVRFNYISLWIMVLVNLTAILFSFSQGAWVALGAGLVVWMYLVGYKKIAVITVVLGLVVVFAVPSLRAAVLFQDQAGRNRITLLKHSVAYLKDSPQNFIFGAGIRQYFRKVEKPYYNPEELERLIYPHNILFNFWTEIGLPGVFGFFGLIIRWFVNVWREKKSNKLIFASLMATMIVILIHGLVDVPYFKNDLAFLSWIIFGLGFIKKN